MPQLLLIIVLPDADELILIKPLTVRPRVHFLGDDVGFFTHAAGKERRVLEYRRANLAEVVAGKDGAGGGLDAVPKRGLRRQQVARAAHGFQGTHNLSSLNGEGKRTNLALQIGGRPV